MRTKPIFRFMSILMVLFLFSLACTLGNTPQNGDNNNIDNNTLVPTETTPVDPPDQPATPTDTSAPPPPPPDPTVTSTEAPAPECTPDSEFVADVNIPDGTLIAPGTTFTKTWTIENDGTCTWTSEYTWEQIDRSGNKLLASAAVAIPHDVPPGGTLNITVTLTLSATATIGERYDAFFQMRFPGGELFGTHPYARIYAVDGSGVCPIGPTGQSLFVNTTDHYCFLYPTGYNAYIGATGATTVNEPPTTEGEQIPPSVSISNYGSSGGLNTNQWANSMITSWQNPSDPATVTNTQVGGNAAKAAEGIPGITGNIVVFQVNDGDGYVFTIQPVDESFPVRSETALDLWEMVRLSFTFYTP